MDTSGAGVLTIPAESHWMLAAEEGAISVLKMAANRFFLKGEEELTVGQAFELVARPQSNHFNGQEVVHVHEARCTCVWRNYEDA